jgi:hypothetical protein
MGPGSGYTRSVLSVGRSAGRPVMASVDVCGRKSSSCCARYRRQAAPALVPDLTAFFVFFRVNNLRKKRRRILLPPPQHLLSILSRARGEEGRSRPSLTCRLRSATHSGVSRRTASTVGSGAASLAWRSNPMGRTGESARRSVLLAVVDRYVLELLSLCIGAFGREGPGLAVF